MASVPDEETRSITGRSGASSSRSENENVVIKQRSGFVKRLLIPTKTLISRFSSPTLPALKRNQNHEIDDKTIKDTNDIQEEKKNIIITRPVSKSAAKLTTLVRRETADTARITASAKLHKKSNSEPMELGDEASLSGDAGVSDDRAKAAFFANGNFLLGRYEILDIIGQGGFGHVLKCRDHSSDSMIAVKVLKQLPNFENQVQSELKMLRFIKLLDKSKKSNVIHYLDSISVGNLRCIVFPLYSFNFSELIQENNSQPFNIGFVKEVALQLFVGLRFLEKNGIVHCDIKPENILLLAEPKRDFSGIPPANNCLCLPDGKIVRPELVITDVGRSCLISDEITSNVQPSLYYRAPEVILKGKLGTAMDVWSVGCVLGELITGSPMFPGNDETDQLSLIIKTLGMPTIESIQNMERTNDFFETKDDGVMSLRENTRDNGTRLIEILDDSTMLNLMRSALQIDVTQRISAQDGLALLEIA